MAQAVANELKSIFDHHNKEIVVTVEVFDDCGFTSKKGNEIWFFDGIAYDNSDPVKRNVVKDPVGFMLKFWL
jgi:hypothetical protein